MDNNPKQAHQPRTSAAASVPHKSGFQMSKSVSIELEGTTEETTDSQTQKTVRCKNCAHEVTSPAFATQPHEHTFRNPAGYSFHVLCYSDAPGAIGAGEPTTEHSWFPEYAWSYAICKHCHAHLGWWFSGSDRFAGLIATRLLR